MLTRSVNSLSDVINTLHFPVFSYDFEGVLLNQEMLP